MMDEISNLNDAQRKAVLATEGPVMVMAGAGSGKTRVLTLRIAHLINDCGVYPDNILAVTFTNKAAREMKERIAKYINKNVSKMWVSTFHSICARILRMEIEYIPGYTKNFTIIDEDDSTKIISEIIDEFNLDTKRYNAKNIRNKISKLKNLTIPSLDGDTEKRIYESYQNKTRFLNLVDFDDLLLLTLRLFKENKDVLEKYQNRFLYIHVDEFQDTNTPQYQIIRLLGYNHTNVFIVGDQDQSIYSFRGAKVENIDRFREDFPATKVIMLEHNYRSTTPILNAANSVILHNNNRYKKNLYTDVLEGEKPGYYIASSAYDEAMFVVDKIKELKLAGFKYSDFALLYRANALSRGFEDVFLRQGIPYVIYGGLSFFARKEIKDMVAYLRTIVFKDDFSLRRIINEPKRKIGETMVKKLTDCANENKCSLFDAIDYMPHSGQGYTNLIEFKFMILELYDDLCDESKELTSIIDAILEKSGYYTMLKAQGEDGKDRLENIKELKTVIKEAMEYYEGDKVNVIISLLQELALKTSTDDADEDDDKVKLMTFHQAKGLEYPVVFLVAFEEGIFPSANCFSQKEIEEERRICYVGITRAKKKLYITSANSRMLYGMTRTSIASRFLSEIGKDNYRLLNKYKTDQFISKKDNNKVSSVSQIKKVELTNTTFKVGDKINHKAFGDGVVVEVNGDIISVIFNNNFGKKKLMANHPSIRKI